MGAMENKGLNIFNTSAVLAHPDIATDEDYERVQAIVGHEYFHNWTGNRVTCRDWFQLTLKEGLTVFRDQEFSADMISTGLDARAAASARAVLRIEQVRDLRASQFPEDAGPMAHPIRPESFQDIANFYTATVYEKGAEVIRMQHTLLGEQTFRKGMELYFARHDGQAVTCDDFVQAMQDAASTDTGRDLTQLRRWYSQAGTPRLQMQGRYEPSTRSYTLTATQHNDKVGVELSQAELDKPPLHIPLAMGLLDAQGQDIPLKLKSEPQGHPQRGARTRLLDITQATQTFTFVDVPAQPVPSLLRNFSAPVYLEWNASDQDLAHLLAHDSDFFNRWEAGQTLALRHLLALQQQTTQAAPQEALLTDALRTLLGDPALDPAFKAQTLMLPHELIAAEHMQVVDPQAIRVARVQLLQSIAKALRSMWPSLYASLQTPGDYRPEPVAAGKRTLKNLVLSYWLETADEQAISAAQSQYQRANNLTDRYGALAALAQAQPQAAQALLADFYKRNAQEPLVVDKWFRLQSGARHATVADVRALLKHKAFNVKNPNRMRAVLSQFFMANPASFHHVDGYALWSESVVQVDAINFEVAARLARALDRWRKLTPALQAHAQAALEKVAKVRTLSKPTREVVEKALAI
jgi:aminopeptidase N